MPALSGRPRPRPLSRPRRTRLGAAALVAVCTLLAAGCGGETPGSSGEPEPPGKAASSGAAERERGTGGGVPEELDFTAPTVAGKEFKGASLAGKDAVLWFWAPWCTVCRAEAPMIKEAAGTHGDRIAFVGIAGRGRTAEMRQFVEDTGIGGFPQAVDTKGGLWSGFGVTAQPAFAFVDDSGAIDVVPGTMEASDLNERLKKLAAS